MKRLFDFLGFLGFYIMEVVRSNLRVAHDVLTLQHHMKPGIIAVNVADLSDRQTLLLANFVTMTPGTLCLHVSPDRSTLYIHAMYVDESAESYAQNLRATYGRRVRRVF